MFYPKSTSTVITGRILLAKNIQDHNKQISHTAFSKTGSAPMEKDALGVNKQTNKQTIIFKIQDQDYFFFI